MRIIQPTLCSSAGHFSDKTFGRIQTAHSKLVRMEQKKRIQVRSCVDIFGKHAKEDLKEIEAIVKEFQEDSSNPEVEIFDDDYFSDV